MFTSATPARSLVSDRSGDVAVGVQDSPDVDVVVVADVEDQVREAVQRPGPQFRNV